MYSLNDHWQDTNPAMAGQIKIGYKDFIILLILSKIRFVVDPWFQT